MQIYRLLGTVNTSLEKCYLVEKLTLLGWVVLTQNENDVLLKKDKIQLSIEGESTLLLNASFKGKPEDISEVIQCLDSYADYYALDLFGDSARLVRRFIK
ncbi:hypothetical protein [Neptunomonas sp.]|uniref:hypothetical protein n=1 Tax=Neptunomonas sp. TaxID=1971898 RepID=UPI0025F2103A|nr:hypothetical protein [Neptunomonas sp.]